jgi:hypothetical protein
MTREEALKRFTSKQLCPAHTTNIINKLFNYFEIRGCESCKYYYKGQNTQWCDNPEINKYRNMAHRVDLDFYCKYWSAKDEDK